MKNEKAVVAGLRSIKIETEPGTYFWCACGRSQKQPFCDGSHSDTNFLPLRVVITEKQRVKWCSCKLTKTPPYCDHSHREIPGYVK
ncbi:MAG: CDGSH iron-sulfur domain-containing protein [Bacteroides sp.]|nr:CDGSH iron-sulfur domain-containing protein [Bacteroides sp.]